MTRLAIFGAGLSLLLAAGAQAQPADQAQNVVRAEAPIVAGNAVSAKKLALASAFRQAVEEAFAEIVKAGPLPSPAPPAVLQLKASLASAAQRFVRSYRLLDQQTEGGMLKVMVEIDVDEASLRREIERASGTAPSQVLPATRQPVTAILVAGAAPASSLTVAALAALGLRAQAAPAGAEAQLAVSAARQNVNALSVAAKSAAEDRVRGTSRIPVKCGITWRLFGAGPQAMRGPAVVRTNEDYGFAGDEPAARQACFESAAAAVAREVATTLRSPIVSAQYVTLKLDIGDVGVIPALLHALKRMGSVSGREVRSVTANAAEIRVFTRIGGPALAQAIGREVGGRLFIEPVQSALDLVVLKVRRADATAPPAEENP
ncbi:MAG: hypothetical protein JXP73_09485 [Deltaproteobacteria bacterium]|nr:hypothetical protein [Deltaproteobacteria bacterium]